MLCRHDGSRRVAGNRRHSAGGATASRQTIRGSRLSLARCSLAATPVLLWFPTALHADYWGTTFSAPGVPALPSCGQDATAENEVDYLIDPGWENISTRRVLQVIPPSTDPDARVRRLVMPRRLEDALFLKMLSIDNLRIDMWPHTTESPHIHLHILIDGLLFDPIHQRRSWFGSRHHLLLFLQAVIHFPAGSDLQHCLSEWRWAKTKSTEGTPSDRFEPPYRVLEVSCPLKRSGFLSPLGSSSSSHPLRGALASTVRVALIMIVMAVCVAQILLLVICITMLLIQTGLQREGRPPTIAA